MMDHSPDQTDAPIRPQPTRTWLLPVLLIAVVGYAVLRNSHAESDWPKDYDQARQAAAADGRPLLIQFTSSGCPYCVKMEREVLHSKPVTEALNRFELVTVDAWSRSDLSSKYRIEGVPLFVVVGPAGDLIARIEGYQPVETFVEFLDRAAAAVSSTVKTTS